MKQLTSEQYTRHFKVLQKVFLKAKAPKQNGTLKETELKKVFKIIEETQSINLAEVSYESAKNLFRLNLNLRGAINTVTAGTELDTDKLIQAYALTDKTIGESTEGKFLEILLRWHQQCPREIADGLGNSTKVPALKVPILGIANSLSSRSEKPVVHADIQRALSNISIYDIISAPERKTKFKQQFAENLLKVDGLENLDVSKEAQRMTEKLFEGKMVTFFKVKPDPDPIVKLFLYSHQSSTIAESISNRAVVVADSLESMIALREYLKYKVRPVNPAGPFFTKENRYQAWEMGASLWFNANAGSIYYNPEEAFKAASSAL